jgi:hypothetical protein
MAASKILIAGAAALLLTGCEGARTGASGAASVCTPFANAAVTPAATTGAATPATAAPLPSADPASALDDCLHRWAYALAPASDDATRVSQAVLAACEPSLGRWNQQTASAGGEGGPPVEAPSLITGEPTSPIQQHLSFGQNRALLYVVQARAGHCAAPPMKDGVPVGLTRD